MGKLLTLGIVVVLAPLAFAEETQPPAPAFDRVRYDRPDDYLVLNPSTWRSTSQGDDAPVFSAFCLTPPKNLLGL